MTTFIIVLTKVGSSNQNILNQDHNLVPHSWLPIRPIEYVVNTYNDKCVTVNLNNKLMQFLFKGYVTYPITNITNIKLLSQGLYQSRIFVTKDAGLEICLIISPDEKEVNLIYFNQEKKIISWLNGVFLKLQK